MIHLCWSQSISLISTCTGDPIWLLHIFRMGGENYQLGTCCHLNLGRQASKCSGESTGWTDSLNPKCLGWRHVPSIHGNVNMRKKDFAWEDGQTCQCSFIALGGRTTRLDFFFCSISWIVIVGCKIYRKWSMVSLQTFVVMFVGGTFIANPVERRPKSSGGITRFPCRLLELFGLLQFEN